VRLRIYLYERQNFTCPATGFVSVANEVPMDYT